MRALVLHDFSGPDGLSLEEIPAPDGSGPGPGKVRIEVHAAGVSFADLLITQGRYQVKPELPFVPGLEVAGVVTAAPAGSGLEVGTRVAAHVFGGAFAEEADADPAMVVPVPGNVGFAAAAGPCRQLPDRLVRPRSPLAEGARALQDLAERRSAGKAVLDVR